MLWIAEVDLHKDFKSNCSGFFLLFLQFYFIISSFCFMYFSPVEEFFWGPDYFCSRSHTTLFNTIFFFISVNEHIFLHVFHVLTPKTRISYNYIWTKYVVYLEHWDTSSDTAYVDVFTLHVPTFSLMYFFLQMNRYHIACSYMHI